MNTRLHHVVVYTFVCLLSLMVMPMSFSQGTFNCNSDLTKVYKTPNNLKSIQPNYPIDTIELFLVCDYALYKAHNNNSTAVMQYIDQLWGRVLSIYAYDSIPLKLAEVKIWTEQDPYSHANAAQALSSFADHTGADFPGRLAHLISGRTGNMGGIAYLNGYCDRTNAFGYANVNGIIDTSADYNWDVHVLAHEIGHNLGSPHTNDCIWGPNGDEAIDGCGQTSNACADANIPSAGGSIMGSCHQYPESVILNQGVGDEPAKVMKSLIRSCSDFAGLTCDNPKVISALGSYQVTALDIGHGATQNDATHSKWFQYIADQDITLDISSCNQPIDTRLYTYTGNCNSLKEIASSDDDCLSSDGLRYAARLTIDLNNGDTILIEWDDKWSISSFSFSLSNALLGGCDNGIRDNDETGVDCGGSSCQSCNQPCTEALFLSASIDNTLQYFTSDTLRYAGIVLQSANLLLGSSSSVELKHGLEIQNGGQLEIIIEDCESTTQSLGE